MSAPGPPLNRPIAPFAGKHGDRFDGFKAQVSRFSEPTDTKAFATAHHWYAEHLAWRGRFDEAFREIERARQLDPLSLIVTADHAEMLYLSRE